jgi:arylsulfatase A-like enzyme
VVFRGGPQPVRDLRPAKEISADEETATLALVKQLNERHLEHAGNEELFSARLRSYELAAKMQLAVPEVSDLARETPDTLALYGANEKSTEECGRRCLLARRLLERGVRFVQIFSGGPVAGSPRSSWDAHENVKENHTAEAARIDKPVAGLLADLKQRGLLEDTLVIFTTEFGRTPFTQSAANQVGAGRDHNRYGFSVWLAGAGLKHGTAIGQTDDIGWKAAERPIPWYDFHATVLRLMGIDHERLTFYHNGIARRLTNVHGHVVTEALA